MSNNKYRRGSNSNDNLRHLLTIWLSLYFYEGMVTVLASFEHNCIISVTDRFYAVKNSQA